MFNFEGCRCVTCRQTLQQGDDIVVCPDCGAPYHRECYDRAGVCLLKDRHAPDFEWVPGPDERPVQEEPAAEQADTALYCPNCGEGNPAGSRQCANCGAVLAAGAVWDMPYVDPSETVDGIALTDWAAYIGGAAHSYLFRFKRMALTGRRIAFSFWAMMFGPLYFFYRKMWKAAAVFSALYLLTEIPSVLALLVVTESPFFTWLSYETLLSMNNVAVVLAWLLRAAAALLAVDLYRRDAGSKISRILQQYPAGRDRQIALAVQGGVSMPAVILAITGLLVLCYCLVPLMGPNLSIVYEMMGL
ncbi:MAG: DUF2628 domain-containing protein [Oscillospiraceae bacterium]|nr:DUF2628 domain-containing protein [Oscillospiraceae bacterium]